MLASPRKITRPAPAPVAAALAALLLSLSAQAALVNSISVSLIAPNGTETDSTAFTLSQSAPLPDGILALNLGGTGDISSFMLDGERISFSGDSIRIRVGAGASNGLNPGLGLGARYEISGLGVVGATITGFNASAFDGYGTSGTSGLAAGLLASSLVSMNAGFDTLNLTLDNALTFTDRPGGGGSDNFAEFRIDLLTVMSRAVHPG